MALITLDFETFYGTKYTLKSQTLLEYINHEKFHVHGVGIKIDDKPTAYYPDYTDIEEVIQDLFYPGNQHTLCCHNTPFDALILDVIYGVRPARYEDTLSEFRGLAHQSPNDLGYMAEALFPDDETKRKGTELSDFKDVERLTEAQQEILGAYCVNDVELTYQCREQLHKFMPPEELDIIDDTIRLWIEPVIRLDIPSVEKYGEYLAKETAELIEKSGETREVLASRPKFIKLLEEKYQIEVPTKISASTGKPTAALGKNDLAFQNLRAETPELADLWEARLNVSSTGEHNRAKRLVFNANCDNGWMRVALKYYGAHSGRFSGTEKINQQNFKRNSPLRLALQAPDDCYVYVADLSQIEARVLAWLSGQTDLVQDFRDGADIYSKFATRLYSRPIDRKKKAQDTEGNYLDKDGNIVTKDDAFVPDFIEGFVGKTCILGLGYGMGPPKFRNTMAQGAMGGPPVFFTEDESKNIVYNIYRGTYQKIVQQWDDVDRLIYDMAAGGNTYDYKCLKVAPNRLILPNGMALNYPRLEGELNDRGNHSFQYWKGRHFANLYGGLGTENIVQALARIILTWQHAKIKKEIPDARLAMQVHDELIYVAPKADAKDRFDHMLGIMNEVPDWCLGLPVTAEGGYAPEYSK